MKDKLKEAYAIYGMNRTQFAKHTKIAYRTLENWEKNGLSDIGEVLINALLEIKTLKDKAEKYDAICRNYFELEQKKNSGNSD